ncbi:AAA family ATPase [Enterovibrio norvegicus]|uniref:AAA family ATPase n=1 Tax=Enterovibrio norvegicus TaxID=188144 RepID=UPI0010BE36E4|nr:AAA family ATPase [Enterovibrio norvegicus]TKF35333.1 ATP-binding protein [Enterovibrio norvegicus]
MSFRVRSFFVEKGHFSTPTVSLSKNEKADDSNYFTVLIGNNGTGKSRFLVNLVDSFREINESNRRINFEYNLEYELFGENFNVERKKHQKVQDRIQNRKQIDGLGIKTPKKLIAVTTSLSDKFPIDGKNKKRDNTIPQEEYYSYLGVRNRIGAASNRALMDKAISLMLSSINEASNNEEYREIFDYLSYEPIIKLDYQVITSHFKKLDAPRIDGLALKDLIRGRAEKRGGFRYDSILRSLETKDDIYWEELAKVYTLISHEVLLQKRKKDFTLLLNFSLENSNREMKKLGINENRLYIILEELRRYELVRGPSIKLYKKGGGEFDFNDASSGEASILSTLIALIPELEDNSLVVVDEPEISLHPSWQYRYVNLLDRIISKKRGCHIFIATHSHFIISDLPVGRSHIVHLKKGNKSTIEADYIEQETQGLAAEDILLNVFDMPSTRNYYLSQQVSEALEILASGDKNNQRYRELIDKFNSYLPNLKKIDPLYDVLIKLVSLGR